MAETNQWIKGALILTLAGLLSRVLGMIYRVPLQNIAGDEGLYVYQQVYPILSLAIILSLYGIPSAITQQLSEERSPRKSLATIFYLLMAIGMVAWAIVFFFAGYLANWMGDPLLKEPIQASSFMFLLLPVISMLRGYFQSREKPHIVGISQVTEQFFRVILIIGVTVWVMSLNESVYELGKWAVIATILGTLASIVYLLIHYSKNKPPVREASVQKISLTNTAKPFLAGVLIYSMTYVLHLLLQAVDVMTMIPLLGDFGLTLEESKIQKGIFDRGNPIIQLGLVFGSSLAFAIIPSLQSQHKLSNGKYAFQLTFIFSLAASAGLIAIMPRLNPALYIDGEGTLPIQWLMLLVFLLSMIITLSVLLQHLGYKQQQFKWLIVMLGIKVVANRWLIPVYGTLGASFASAIATTIVLIIFYAVWINRSGVQIGGLFVAKSIGIAGIMFVIVTMLENMLPDFTSRLLLIIPILTLCLAGVIVFLTLIWFGRLFPKKMIKELFHFKTKKELK